MSAGKILATNATEEQAERIKSLVANLKGSNGSGKLKSPEEIEAEPIIPQRPVVEGMLYTQNLVSIIGDPGSGKSSWLVSLAAAILQGKPFLERKTLAGPIIFLMSEEHRRKIWNRMKAQGVSSQSPIHTLATEDYNVLDLMYENEVVTRSDLRKDIQDLKPIAVIFDIATDFFSWIRDISTEHQAISITLRRLQRMAQDTDVLMVGAFHPAKENKSKGQHRVRLSGVGSHKFDAKVDLKLDLFGSEDSPRLLVNAKNRDYENVSFKRVMFTVERKTHALVVIDEEAIKAEKDEKLFLDFLEESEDDWLSISKIGDGIGRSGRVAKAIAFRLEAARWISIKPNPKNKGLLCRLSRGQSDDRTI